MLSDTNIDEQGVFSIMTSRRRDWDHLASVLGLVAIIFGLFLNDIHPSDYSAHVGLLISLFGLVFPVWIEARKLSHAIGEIEKKIISTVTLAPEIRDDPVCVETIKTLVEPTIKTLVEPTTGIARAKHIFALRKASYRLHGRYFTAFRTDSFKNDEFRRMDLLGDVLAHASKRVMAYTFANKDNLSLFWGSPDPALERYFQTHKEVLSRRLRRISLERIFVYPDDLAAASPASFAILVATVMRLRIAGMSDGLYVIKESSARACLADINMKLEKRGYFLGDSDFVSRERDTEGTESAYAIFNCIQEDGNGLVDHFNELRGAHDTLTDREFADMMKNRDQRSLSFDI